MGLRAREHAGHAGAGMRRRGGAGTRMRAGAGTRAAGAEPRHREAGPRTREGQGCTRGEGHTGTGRGAHGAKPRHRGGQATPLGGRTTPPRGARMRVGTRLRVREGRTREREDRETRREGERGGRERREGRGSSPWDPKFDDNRPPDHLGQGDGREVEERERELLHGKPTEREVGGRQGRAGARRARLGRAGLGCGPGQKSTTHRTIDRSPITKRKPETRRDGCVIKHNIKQRNMLRRDATPMST
jgi:hypothetical protein